VQLQSNKAGSRMTEAEVRTYWTQEDGTSLAISYSRFGTWDPNNWGGLEQCVAMQTFWPAVNSTSLAVDLLDIECWHPTFPRKAICSIPDATSAPVTSALGSISR
jgi:hypothetical protein